MVELIFGQEEQQPGVMLFLMYVLVVFKNTIVILQLIEQLVIKIALLTQYVQVEDVFVIVDILKVEVVVFLLVQMHVL
jgi:hypothetical protein